MDKKVLLIFNGYYIPAKNYGGPSASIRNFTMACADTFDIRIIVRNHDYGDNHPYGNILDGWNNVYGASVLYCPDESFNMGNYKKWILDNHPVAIWLCGIYSLYTPFITRFAGKLGIKVIMSPRGSLNTSAVHYKAYKKLPFLFIERITKVYRNTYFHSTCADETLGIMQYLNIHIDHIYEIPNLPLTYNGSIAREKKEGYIKIIYIARITPIKNLLTAIKAVKMLSCSAVFDIYGSIENEEYWNTCLKEMADLPLNIQIKYCGILSPDDVGNYLLQYHCMLLPTTTENYGHSIAEALTYGCPVIISKGTTPWDCVNGNAGYTVPLYDLSAYKSAIEAIADLDQEKYGKYINQTKKFISDSINIENIKQKYIEMIDNGKQA